MATTASAVLGSSLPPEATHLSLEEYLRTSYRPDREYVDGEIEERNVGELEHSTLQIALGAWFFNRRLEWKIRVLSEQRTRVSSTRVRLPDVCLISSDTPREQITLTPPLLAIEILSPDDRLPRVIKRLDDFVAMGVQNLWLLDPIERSALVYTREGLRLIETPRLEIPESPIYLDLVELFSALD